MAAEKIGLARCPVCKSGGASVSLSKKLLVCMTCNACNLQIFARSGRSDELLRACITAPPTASPQTAPEAAKPEPAPTPSIAPVAPAVAPPAPPAAPARSSFGLGSWLK